MLSFIADNCKQIHDSPPRTFFLNLIYQAPWICRALLHFLLKYAMFKINCSNTLSVALIPSLVQNRPLMRVGKSPALMSAVTS